MIRSWAQFTRLIKLEYIWDWCSRSVYKLEYCYDWCYIILQQWAKLHTSHWCRKPSLKPCTKWGKSRRILHQELAVTKALSPNSCMERLLGGRNVAGKLVTTERDDRSLERIVRSNHFNNLVEITRECQDHGVTVSRATIHRWLQEMSYRSRIPVTKPLLNSRQKQKRIVWSTERKNWTVARWTKVLFTDESKFCITFGNTMDLECGDYQERRINQAAPNQVSSFPNLSWSGERWWLVVLDNSVSWSLMLMPEVYQQVLEYFMLLPAGEEIFGCADFTFQQDLAPAQCQINNEVTRRPWHWGAPLACKFTRPQSNGEFVGTDEKENVEGATKHPRGTQRCHSKSVELCHTWGPLPSSFVHATAHSGSYCTKGCCYQVLTILNCYDNSCFY